MRRNLRDPAKEQYWREILGRFYRSGLSTKAFALKEGVNHHSLSSWKYIIRERDSQTKREAQVLKNQRQSQTRKEENSHVFVPMVVRERPQPIEKERTGVVAEVTFAGHCVRIFNGVDTTTLSVLMQTLKEEVRARNDQQHKDISVHGAHGHAQEF
jgi:hypothetical protein